MARIRTIKPEFWESEVLGRLSPLARLTFAGLISHADDAGRGRGEVGAMYGRMHAYASSAVRARFKRCLSELKRVKLVVFYKGSNNCSYYWIPGFNEHQRIDKPSPSRFPPPPGFVEEVENATDPLPDLSTLDQGSGKGVDQGKEGRGEDLGSPSSEVIRQLMQKAKIRKIPNKPDTLRTYLEAWVARTSGAEVERVLMLPETIGRTVLEIQDAHFKDGAKGKSGADGWRDKLKGGR